MHESVSTDPSSAPATPPEIRSSTQKSGLVGALAAIATFALVASGCGGSTKSKWLIIRESKNAINLASVTRIGLGEAPTNGPIMLRRRGYQEGARIQLWFDSNRLELEFESNEMAARAYDQIDKFLTNRSTRLEVSLGNTR